MKLGRNTEPGIYVYPLKSLQLSSVVIPGEVSLILATPYDLRARISDALAMGVKPDIVIIGVLANPEKDAKKLRPDLLNKLVEEGARVLLPEEMARVLNIAVKGRVLYLSEEVWKSVAEYVARYVFGTSSRLLVKNLLRVFVSMGRGYIAILRVCTTTKVFTELVHTIPPVYRPNIGVWAEKLWKMVRDSLREYVETVIGTSVSLPPPTTLDVFIRTMPFPDPVPPRINGDLESVLEPIHPECRYATVF